MFIRNWKRYHFLSQTPAPLLPCSQTKLKQLKQQHMTQSETKRSWSCSWRKTCFTSLRSRCDSFPHNSCWMFMVFPRVSARTTTSVLHHFGSKWCVVYYWLWLCAPTRCCCVCEDLSSLQLLMFPSSVSYVCVSVNEVSGWLWAGR